MSVITLSLKRSQSIKGLAIIAVVLVHVLAYLPGIYHGSWQLFFIGIDQLARFCVPAFLLISGYGLMYKYRDHTHINYLSFLKHAASKLLPLYLLWSLASILIIKSVPAWSFFNQPMSLWVQLLFGQADYQLYFVIVLLQFYLLFPLLWRYRMHLSWVLLVALLAQLSYYHLFISGTSNNERFEYVFGLSWIVYFVAGMYLYERQMPTWLIRLAPWLSAGTVGLVVWIAQRQINAGIDPLPALKFTKLSIVPMTLLLNLSLISAKTLSGKIWTAISSMLALLGQHSYLIFLAHTLGLRLLYSLVTAQLDWQTLVRTSALWLGLIAISLYLSQAKQS